HREEVGDRDSDRGDDQPRHPDAPACPYEQEQCLRQRAERTEEEHLLAFAITRDQADEGEAHGRRDGPTERGHYAVRRRGSSASRSESPNRLKPNTAMLIATPGAMASHGACSRNCMPAPRSISPHDGVGSNTPSPRNESEASSRIACPRNAVSMIRYGANTFGAMWRNMMRTAPEPTARVASMYGMFTMLSALERTTRATRGMIGNVIAAMTLPILPSPVPSAATTALAITTRGKLRRTSMRSWLSWSTRPPRYAPSTPRTRPSVQPTNEAVKQTSSAVREQETIHV